MIIKKSIYDSLFIPLELDHIRLNIAFSGTSSISHRILLPWGLLEKWASAVTYECHRSATHGKGRTFTGVFPLGRPELGCAHFVRLITPNNHKASAIHYHSASATLQCKSPDDSHWNHPKLCSCKQGLCPSHWPTGKDDHTSHNYRRCYYSTSYCPRLGTNHYGFVSMAFISNGTILNGRGTIYQAYRRRST